MDKKERWMTPLELLTSMGYPVTKSAQEATYGTLCQFSRGTSPPGTRTTLSVCNQAGNAVHMNAVGAAIFCVVLKLPGLGAAAAISAPSFKLMAGTKRKSKFESVFERITKARQG